MKLTLTNFRCYTKQTFEFDEQTTTLIIGPSGHGKTTILLAIQFVLYGSTSQKFLVSYNKTSCEVVLEYTFRNIKFNIKRTKRPNILNLSLNNNFTLKNDLYEDKEAQVIINRYFGNRYVTSFLDLSQLDKLQFLQEIANSDCDVQTLKARVKNEIASLNTALATLSGQISRSESILELWQKPRVVAPPIPPSFCTLYKSKVQSAQERFFEGENDVTVLSAMKVNVLKRLSETRKRADVFHSLSGQAQALRQQLGDNDTFEDGAEKLESMLEELDNIEKRRSVLERMRKSYFAVEECVQQLASCEDVFPADVALLERELADAESAVVDAQSLEELRRFREVKAEYLEALATEMNEHRNACNVIQHELDELPVSCGSFKDIQKTLFKLGEAQAFNSQHVLEVVLEEIEELKQRFFKHFRCFNCNHPFTINMDTFEMSALNDDENKPNGHSLNKCGAEVEQLSQNIKKLEQIKEQIVLNNVFISNTDTKILEKELRSCELKLKLVALGEFVPSKHLAKLSKKVKKLEPQKQIGDGISKEVSKIYLKYAKTELNVDELKDVKRDLEIRLNCKRDQLLRRQALLAKIEKRESYDEREYEEVSKRFIKVSMAAESLKSEACVREKLTKLEQKLVELQYEKDELEKLSRDQIEIDSQLEYLERLREYKIYEEQLVKYAELEHDLQTLHADKKEMERRYFKTLLFKQKVVEAEHESLQQTVDTINSHLNMLLQDFFSESFGDPIQIYLDLVNDNKRPRVDTVINYKGNKIDYKSLSTGEYARVKLAFDLAFKDIFNEHIVMLDECTANLDQDLSTKIFAKIQSAFPSKTILVVAHQVVIGVFDHVLKV